MKIFLFLIGLFSLLRVHLIGMIGISEIPICLMGPFFFVKNYSLLRRDGFLPMAYLILLTCTGCIVASWLNFVPFANWVRGLATLVVFFCSFIFLHNFLRKDLDALKWLFAGIAISSVLVMFWGAGEDFESIASEESGYSLTVLLAPLFTVPLFLFYNRMPWFVSFSLLFCGGVFKIFTSESGRSASLVLFAGSFLIWIGRKSATRMAVVRKRFVLYLVLGVVGLFVAKTMYTYAASSGLLGERARAKYVAQTGGSNSFASILIGGRSEAFICIMAALDKPIVGYGPWALDTEGYSEQFRQKYGIYDYEEEAKRARWYAQAGLSRKIEFIPFHSHIFGGWVWYGIFGLVMWGYVLHIIIKFYRKAPDAIPQWWPCFSIVLPAAMWHILFSPFGGRVNMAALVCAALFALKMSSGKWDPGRAFWKERQKFLP